VLTEQQQLLDQVLQVQWALSVASLTPLAS
jgi:hypothetical protein